MCLDLTLSLEKPSFYFASDMLYSMVFLFWFFFLGGPNIWAITSEERAKHDKQFDSLKPTGGYITGRSEILHYMLTYVCA